jgi:integrase
VIQLNKPPAISGDQAAKIIRWLNGRYKIIFQLAVESGLRISDLLKLKCGDVRTSKFTIYETKSRRKRTFTISDGLFKDISWQAAFGRDDDYVFQSHHKTGRPIHRTTIHRAIKKALKFVPQCDFSASTHSARKLYARTIFDQSGSIRSVQRALNHQKLSTTMTYLDFPQQNDPENEKSATLWQKFKTKIKNFFRR